MKRLLTVLVAVAFAGSASAQIAPSVDRRLRALEGRTAGVINVKDPRFGAKCDGVTDDTVAIQAALDAAKTAVGATVVFPPGTCKAASQLSLSAATGIHLLGFSASTQTTGGSVLQYTGTASPFLLFTNSSSPKIDGLAIRYTNAAFAGTLVAFPGCADVTITRSAFLGSGVSGALYLLSLDTATEIGVSDSVFDFAQYAILGQNPAGGGYANAVSLRKLRFGSGITVADIRNPGQGWSIAGTSFENIANGKGQAIKMSDSQLAIGLHVSGSWFGDATENSTAWAWIEFVGDGLTVQGNYIHGTGTPTASGIKIMGTTRGLSVTGNRFSALSIGIDIGTALVNQGVIAGNGFDTVTTRVSGTPADKLWLMDGAGGLALDVWSGGARALTVSSNGGVTGQRLITPVSADRGDTSQTLTVGTDAQIQRWATALTANRTVTCSTTGAANGDSFRVVRTGLGAFTLDVCGLKTIASATAASVDVAYSGSAWVLTGYSPL